jgi:hypothetical protein
MRDAAQQESIDALYALIQRDAKVLDRIIKIPFVNTPLHDAAYTGHIRFAMEILRYIYIHTTLPPRKKKKIPNINIFVLINVEDKPPPPPPIRLIQGPPDKPRSAE